MTDLDHTRLLKAGNAPDHAPLESAALARLIEEVRNAGDGAMADVTAYNRTYHRHNR